MSHHRSLGKQRNSNKSDKWKSNLRNRCLSSLKNKRKNKLEILRNDKNNKLETEHEISLIIQQEMKLIQQEEENYIKNEIMSEEERCEFIQSLEDYLYKEYLFQLSQDWEDSQDINIINNNNDVACVICKRGKLKEMNGNIICNCGFIYSLQKKQNIKSIKDFESIVLNYIYSHGNQCNGNGDFYYSTSNTGDKVLTYSCPECYQIEII